MCRPRTSIAKEAAQRMVGRHIEKTFEEAAAAPSARCWLTGSLRDGCSRLSFWFPRR